MKTTRMSVVLVLVLGLMMCLAGVSHAATSIDVENYSFEYYADGSQILGHMAFGPANPGALSGWTGTKDWVGVDVECASNIATPWHCHNFYATDGIAYLYMQNIDTQVYQVLEHYIVADRQYTLTFDALTGMGDMPSDAADKIVPSFFYVDDSGNHVELASEAISLELIDLPLEECGGESTVAPGTCWGWMYNLTLSFNTQYGADYVGKPLGISFSAPTNVPPAPKDSAYSFVDNVRVDMGAYEATKVTIDIKPQTCPNRLNINSRDLLTVAILGTEDFDVYDIDPASVELNGVSVTRSSYDDILTSAQSCTCDGAVGPDGYPELIVKFEIEALVEKLGEVGDGDEVELTLTGVLSDETAIKGTDCVLILDKAKDL